MGPEEETGQMFLKTILSQGESRDAMCSVLTTLHDPCGILDVGRGTVQVLVPWEGTDTLASLAAATIPLGICTPYGYAIFILKDDILNQKTNFLT